MLSTHDCCLTSACARAADDAYPDYLASCRRPVMLVIRRHQMHPNDEATIRSFIKPVRRPRWLESLSDPKRREKFLDCLNHCCDIEERRATPLRSNFDVSMVLKGLGAPSSCYLISATAALDGREMPLDEALPEVAKGGWGTLVSCIPGKLAYYYDEFGERRMLLRKQ